MRLGERYCLEEPQGSLREEVGVNVIKIHVYMSENFKEYILKNGTCCLVCGGCLTST